MPSNIEMYLKIKREEYEYAQKHNLKALAEVTRQAVKKTCKKFKVTPQSQQLELF